MNEIGIRDILYFLITLYAIVPSIIITVMYNFLSSIEERLSDIWSDVKNYKADHDQEEEKELKKKAGLVDKFVIVSAKAFHYSMAYYLMLLFFALFAKLLHKTGQDSLNFISVGIALFLVYGGAYYALDVHKALCSTFLENELFNIKDRKGLIVNILYIVFCYFFIPIITIYFLYNIKNMGSKLLEITTHLSWITSTIVHLLIWWLAIPFKYKPLTNLSYIIRRIK